MSAIKYFHVRTPHLHHPMADEVVQYVCRADLGLSEPSIIATHFGRTRVPNGGHPGLGSADRAKG